MKHYEIIAFVSQKVLSKLLQKIDKNEKILDRDCVACYEATSTLYTIAFQLRYFNFSDIDIIYTFLHSELDLKFDMHGDKDGKKK